MTLLPRRGLLAGLPLATGLGHGARGQEAGLLSRPIRLIVPFPPGGPTDIMGRTTLSPLPVTA